LRPVEWLRSRLCVHKVCHTNGSRFTHTNRFPSSVPMGQMSMESSLQLILRQAAGPDRAFVILGFLTGLALSAMIGAALYIYLTLGW